MGKQQPYGSRKNRRAGMHWGELNNLFEMCRGLMGVMTFIYPYLSDTQRVFATVPVERRRDFHQTCMLMATDVQRFSHGLEALRQSHVANTGAIKPHELMDAISISEAYFQWSLDFRVVVWPLVRTLAEHLQVLDIIDPYLTSASQQVTNILNTEQSNEQ